MSLLAIGYFILFLWYHFLKLMLLFLILIRLLLFLIVGNSVMFSVFTIRLCGIIFLYLYIISYYFFPSIFFLFYLLPLVIFSYNFPSIPLSCFSRLQASLVRFALLHIFSSWLSFLSNVVSLSLLYFLSSLACYVIVSLSCNC